MSVLRSPRRRTRSDKYAIRKRSDDVYEAVRQAIMDGRFLPGTQLSEVLLAKDLGVSRTPVRDALPRLVAEGFLEQVAGLGVFVRKLDRQEAVELWELRRVIEAGAAAMAAERCSPDQARELAELAEQTDNHQRQNKSDAKRELDWAFHHRMCDVAGNSEISRALFMTGVIHMTFTPAFLREVRHRVFADHVVIAEAIADKNPDRAYRAMWDHFDGVLAQLSELPEFA